MRIRLRLTKPATGRRLTWQGWLLVILLLAGGIVWWAHTVEDFLSPVRPLPGATVLMVEGFLPDYALEQAADEYKSGDYATVVTTGQRIEQGTFLSKYRSMAAISGETLKVLGVDSERLFIAPAKPVWRDRSVANARAGFEKLAALGLTPCKVNLMSLSVHSRRSWLIFKKVGEEYGCHTGIIALSDSTFDEPRWWKSSRGLRAVATESLAYYYVSLFGLSD